MRILAISIGNTSITGGAFAAGKRPVHFRSVTPAAPSARTRPSPILPAIRGGIDHAVVCSVVPKLTRLVANEIERRFGVTPELLTAGSSHGLKIAYRKPRELGVDRIAAALGARETFGSRHVIVVDCGTATTVTALRRDGTILGGAIFPGLSSWSAMLAARTAQLPEVPLRRPRAAVGRSTREGLQSGIFYGHAGAVRELVQQIRREAFGRGEVLVIGTGGNVRWLSREALFSHVIPNLVLIGLARFGKVETDQPQ